MDNELDSCPECHKGVIKSKIIDVTSDNTEIEHYLYSCGHKVDLVNFYESCICTEEFKIKGESEEKIGNKPVYEFTEKIAKNDIDNPDKYVHMTMYVKRNDSLTVVFQVVRYDTGEVKHVHCKKCNNDWDYRAMQSIKDKFIFEHGQKIKIQCLNCGLTFEQ